MREEKSKLLIIGAGPAGYTAAIYAARAGLAPLLYQGPEPGGQLMMTSTVENYPGYAEGVLGPDMMEHFRKQAARFGTEIRIGMATNVDFSQYPFSVTIDHKLKISAKAVIIATGSSAKWLGLPSEEHLHGKGVSACATCDGFFFRKQKVAVVGGGDTAAEEALCLANLCSKVYLIVRRNVMRASSIMQKRVMANQKIKILWESVTEEILGKEKVEGVRIRHVQSNTTQDIAVQGFFVAIGHLPNTKLFAPYLACNEQGYIKTKPSSTHTSQEGVFAAGDVQDPIYRQAVTAAGSGCMAALDAERFLARKDFEKF